MDDATAPAKKPPPMVIGVTGVEAAPITMHSQAGRGIDWLALSSLPPFQMYLSETRRASPSEIERMANPLNHDGRIEALKAMIERIGPQLYDEYAEWHQKKGYWPNETPMGGARE